jgi:hypothetical protein
LYNEKSNSFQQSHFVSLDGDDNLCLLKLDKQATIKKIVRIAKVRDNSCKNCTFLAGNLAG